ncbi:MAG: ABC transporter permease subunit [Actinomycetota bacterium]|nr:ABC transporter permease subunit [Actinomycetota bacterium]
MGRERRWLPPLVAIAMVVVAWQLVAANYRYVLPRPASVLRQLVDHPGDYVHSGRITLLEALLGLLFGFGAAVAVALLAARLPLLGRAVLPLAVLLNVTPVVAIAPGLVVAFGFGLAPKVIVTAVICFFPTMITTTVGLRSADPAVLEVLHSLHASETEILLRARLPTALPYLFAAARLCLPLSVIGAVVAEFVTPGSTDGLGTVIFLAAPNSQLDRVYAAVICLGIIGVALTFGIGFAERRMLSWHQSQRSPI